MGWMTCFGSCIVCDQPFSFNPHAVPSVRVNGEREPICQNCIAAINIKRKLLHVAEIKVAEDAYKAVEE